jgi:hypothetical protein
MRVCLRSSQGTLILATPHCDGTDQCKALAGERKTIENVTRDKCIGYKGEQKEKKWKYPSEQPFHISTHLTICGVVVLIGNMPSRYTRNFLPVLYNLLVHPLTKVIFRPQLFSISLSKDSKYFLFLLQTDTCTHKFIPLLLN